MIASFGGDKNEIQGYYQKRLLEIENWKDKPVSGISGEGVLL